MWRVTIAQNYSLHDDMTHTSVFDKLASTLHIMWSVTITIYKQGINMCILGSTPVDTHTTSGGTHTNWAHDEIVIIT